MSFSSRSAVRPLLDFILKNKDSIVQNNSRKQNSETNVGTRHHLHISDRTVRDSLDIILFDQSKQDSDKFFSCSSPRIRKNLSSNQSDNIVAIVAKQKARADFLRQIYLDTLLDEFWILYNNLNIQLTSSKNTIAHLTKENKKAQHTLARLNRLMSIDA